MREREQDWAALMHAANAGDSAAYRRLLEELAIALRAIVRRGFSRYGVASGDAEDVVQETLLAIHLKRHTWDAASPLGPWVAAIARNKLIDALRRRGRRGAEVDIDALAEVLPAREEEEALSAREIDRLLGTLSEGQRAVVQAVSVDGASIRETAGRLGMSEGAVRVALHRGLAALAARFRSTER